MAWISVIGECLICKHVFSYNPNLVPTFRVNANGHIDPKGTKEPVCEGCLSIYNEKRRQYGLPETMALPGAYEACEEADL
jgi:hypothetical protein